MITSTSNIKIKRLVSLKRKRKLRDAEKVFLVEGLRMFREVPDGALLEVYVTQAFYDREKSLIEKKKRNSGVSMEILADTVFEYVADTKHRRGSSAWRVRQTAAKSACPAETIRLFSFLTIFRIREISALS